MEKLKIAPYDEDTKVGYLRHLLVRIGKVTGEVMVVLVTACKKVPNLTALVNQIVALHPNVTTVVQNINGKKTSMVLGRTEIVHYGEGKIKDKLCGLTFNISPRSFYQINHSQTEKLYQYAIKAANIRKSDTVLDAYSGIGTISLICAKYAKHVTGVEINETAVKDAVENAKQNGIKNAEFIYADAGEYLKQMAQQNNHFDVVIVDPPRGGCSKAFIDNLKYAKPKRIVYISCNPVTQARDLKQIQISNYRVVDIQPFDLFPFTTSVENIVVLSRNSKG